MIKVDLEHNLSSLRIPELRLDPQSTILALKENIEKRYGSEAPYIRLVLKNKKGEAITPMDEDLRSLDFYGVQNGMIISVMDLNPSSILKEIENNTQIEKYVMSEETYNALPDNFRKWKHQFLLENPQVKHSLSGQPEICDPDYLHSVANTLSVGMRCQLENGARGEIRFIGKVGELGFGWFVGIELDEPQVGLGNGIIGGMHYFFCDVGRGYF
jgi:tubulin-folding cofactor B